MVIQDSPDSAGSDFLPDEISRDANLPNSSSVKSRAKVPLIRRVGKYVARGSRPHHLLCFCRGTLTAAFSGADRFGRRPWMDGKVCFHVQSTLIVGDYFHAGGHSTPVCIKVQKGGKLTIGDHVGINVGTRIEAYHDMKIGNYVMIAPFVSIIDDNCHDIEPGWPRYRRPVNIGNSVWLGQNVIVLPGVTIGNGSVIGAGSVVSKDIPENVYAAGVPARVIRALNIPDGWTRE